MILRYSLLSFGLVAFGTVIGVILVKGPRGAWYWLLDETAGARAWLTRKAMPASGTHVTGGQARLPDLPETPEHPRYGALLNDTPAEGIGVAFPEGTIYVGAHERFVPRKRTADHTPWSGSFRAVPDSEVPDVATLVQQYDTEQERVDWIKSQLPENGNDVTREDMERVLTSLRAMPVYGQAPQLAVDEAQRQAGALRP